MKLSSIATIALCGALAASCSGKKTAGETETFVDPFDYTLTVTNIAAGDSTVAYLYDYDALAGSRSFNPEALIDSVFVSDSTAVFTIEGTTAPVGMLVIGDASSHIIIPEAGANTYDIATGIGSGALAQKFAVCQDSVKAVIAWANENAPEHGTPEFDAFADSINNLLAEINNGFIVDNAGNSLGYLLLVNAASEMPSEKFDSIVAAAPRLATTKRIQAVQDEFKKLGATSVGCTYTDFTIDNDSATVSLSQYVKPGQYTLVDFWASWCGPCKRAIASLKENYDELHAKGLNVVGVAVWEDADDTRRWLEANPLPWDIILDAQTVPTDLYAVKGIPTMILVGPDGKILARSYSDEEVLEAFNAAIGE